MMEVCPIRDSALRTASAARLGEAARNEDFPQLRFGNHLRYGSLLAHFAIPSCYKSYIIFVT